MQNFEGQNTLEKNPESHKGENKMSYSCTKNADDVLKNINDILQSKYRNKLPKTKNGQVIDFAIPNGFFEIGKENYDGAITGTVWKFQKDTSEISENSYIKKAGSFRINPNGFIKRFPLLPKEIKKSINNTFIEEK